MLGNLPLSGNALSVNTQNAVAGGSGGDPGPLIFGLNLQAAVGGGTVVNIFNCRGGGAANPVVS